jgi:hypothetical protein
MAKWTPEYRKEYMRKYNIEWEKKNKEYRDQYRKERYLKNKDKQIVYSTQWAKDNKDKVNLRQRTARLNNKIKAIEYLGGVCKNCKNKYPPRVFDFHHVDGSTKDISMNKAIRLSWNKVKVEMDKCILLCANCHRLEHNKFEDEVIDGI